MNPQKMFIRDFHSWKSFPPNYTYDAKIVEFMMDHPVLSERERDMLHRRYIDKQTLQDIGVEYNLTRERIRQVINAAMIKLKNTHEGEELIGAKPHRDYNAFNYPELPVPDDCFCSSLPAGYCTMIGLYDEENDTYTVRIVRTLSKHEIGSKHPISKNELGKVIAAITFEDPAQIPVIAHSLEAMAAGINFMKDPSIDKDYKDILMGRYTKKYYPV